MAQSMKDCPVLPSYFHANIGETSCMLAVRPDLVNIADAVDEEDYTPLKLPPILEKIFLEWL
jgi:creatinine amidohydrolase/Fe(II)-dependent formamide hydrolase-like protein